MPNKLKKEKVDIINSDVEIVITQLNELWCRDNTSLSLSLSLLKHLCTLSWNHTKLEIDEIERNGC